MNKCEVLKQARELISNEGRWCQGELAETAQGAIVNPSSINAYRWCAEGALCKVLNIDDIDFNNDSFSLLNLAIKKEFPELKGKVLFHLNDDKGHAAVLKVYDRAIEDCENESM